jgi:hypothetical protein
MIESELYQPHFAKTAYKMPRTMLMENFSFPENHLKTVVSVTLRTEFFAFLAAADPLIFR